jgi:hypothetical protein
VKQWRTSSHDVAATATPGSAAALRLCEHVGLLPSLQAEVLHVGNASISFWALPHLGCVLVLEGQLDCD